MNQDKKESRKQLKKSISTINTVVNAGAAISLGDFDDLGMDDFLRIAKLIKKQSNRHTNTMDSLEDIIKDDQYKDMVVDSLRNIADLLEKC